MGITPAITNVILSAGRRSGGGGPTPVYYGDFDGSGDFLTLAALTPHPAVNSTNYSFAWQCKVDTAGRMIAGKSGDTTNYLAYFNGTTVIQHKPNGAAAGFMSFSGLANTTSAIRRYVLIRNGNGNTFKLFQDGVEFAGTVNGTVPNNTAQVNLIGKYSAGLEFDGQLYYFKAWNDSLTDEEAIAESTDGSGPTDSSLRLNLQFTDGPGSPIVTDLANGNNGTITGMTWGTVE